jgi:folate-dependent phosphoribosylglycinamide formyltransferase PurN
LTRGKVILLGAEGESTRMLYHALCADFDLAAVILEAPVPRREFLARRVRRYGRAHVAGQVLFRTLAVPWLVRRSRARRREIAAAFALDDSEIPGDMVTKVPSVNDDRTVALLQQHDPQAVVVSGTRIVSAKVLGAVSAPFLNIHAGITPLYRGVHGAYWALAQGDPENCGVTVHLLDERIDTGPILGQARIAPTDGDDFTTYPLLQLAAGIPLLKRALTDVLAARPAVLPPPAGASRYWTHPTLVEYLRYRRRGVR